LNFLPYVIDTEKQHISRSGELVNLTQNDYEVAVCLFQNIGKALSRDVLLKTVWEVGAALDTSTVDMHVSRVRRALKAGPENGYIIKTIYQHGYRLENISSHVCVFRYLRQ
jgi:DNA-binding response OmpR family regulator